MKYIPFCSWLVALALCVGVSGCGQKGDLYLPEKGAPAKSLTGTLTAP